MSHAGLPACKNRRHSITGIIGLAVVAGQKQTFVFEDCEPVSHAGDVVRDDPGAPGVTALLLASFGQIGEIPGQQSGLIEVGRKQTVHGALRLVGHPQDARMAIQASHQETFEFPMSCGHLLAKADQRTPGRADVLDLLRLCLCQSASGFIDHVVIWVVPNAHLLRTLAPLAAFTDSPDSVTIETPQLAPSDLRKRPADVGMHLSPSYLPRQSPHAARYVALDVTVPPPALSSGVSQFGGYRNTTTPRG